ncbi:MAG: tRNA (adenosine(37)-N6)-dimethylallyltransferase MiaA [Abitibacteriaceae bacterium]|nr:tRNA (adenosine(37)-N6)-dimethylallyltransferase MiaA [Abditibacteriaceae bacterium]
MDNGTSPQHSALSTQHLLLLVGPTGIGKTAVAVELCQMLNGEVVSADSMQIYRGCDIGTAKPSAEERARARHHLIDIREPTESYSAAQWAQDGASAISDISERGKQPIVVGGTGFYIRALLDPHSLADVPPNPELRTRLEAEATAKSAQWLHNYLASLDAVAAQRLHPHDVRRVIRAIEVASTERLLTTEHQTPLVPIEPQYDAVTFGLDMPREQLYARLEQRIDAMLQAGMLDELQWLLNQGISLASPLMQGLGYRQLLPALSNPATLADCVQLWKRDTRRYAKRQLTWFRHQLPVQWITIEQEYAPTEVAQQIAQQWQYQRLNKP